MIPNTITAVQYPGNGVSTIFPYPNKIFAATDLVVSLVNNATGAAAIQGFPTDYTVQGVDVDTGAQVTILPAPPAGYTLDIRSLTAMLQLTSIKNQGKFLPELHEEAFDRVTREIQDAVRRTYTYGIHGPDNETLAWPALPGPAGRKGFGLIFDSIFGLPALGAPSTITYTQSTLGQLLTPQTPNEFNKGIVPARTWYAEGHILRYGAMLDGIADDTVAIQTWLSLGGQLSFPLSATALITGQLTMISNTTITAAKGATITTATPDISILYATGKSNITITGLSLTQTVTSAAAYIGHVALLNCTDCRIENCTTDGYQWGAFYLDGCVRCYVIGNRITNSNTTTNDSADIILYRQCLYCYVAFNECFGTTGKTGVMVQDPYSLPQLTPFKNTVTHNKIGSHLAYGALLYLTARSALGGMNLVNAGSITAAGSAYTDGQYNGVAVSAVTGTGSGATANVTVAGGVVTAFYCATVGGNYADLDTVTVAAGLIGGTGSGFVFTLAVNTVCQALNTYNEISHNLIQDIVGSYLSGASGMGIYAVGAGLGGTKIIGNTVKNCCTGSSGGALAQAAVTVAGLPAFAGGVAVEVLGNLIGEQTQYQGLYLTGMQCPVVVTSGGITIPSTNTTGAALRITNCSNVTIGGGLSIVQAGSGQAILVQSLTNTSAKINFGTMQVVSAAGTPLLVSQSLGLGVPDFKLIGADISTTSVTPNGLSMSGVTDGIITGNKISVGNQAVIAASDCSGTVYESNVLKRLAGTVVVSFGGTGSLNVFGKSNRGVAANGAVVNGAAAGVMIELNGAAAPGVGTWAIGDRVNQTVPVVGQPKGWRCTVAGAPGTWVSEGNL